MNPDLKKQILKDFEEKRSLYESFSNIVLKLLIEIADENGIKYISSCRAKEHKSLSEKLDKKGDKYKSLDDVPDLAGCRMVFYLLDDKKEFVDRLYEQLEACLFGREEKYDSAGYRATHINFRFDEDRSKQIEYKKFAGMGCEIQISTTLDHTWSEIERVIYKPNGDKQLLKTLGQDELQLKFKNLSQAMSTANFQLNHLYRRSQEIVTAGQILGSDLVNRINTADNDEINGILESLEKVFHKKPEQIFYTIQQILRKEPKEAVVIHTFGNRKIYGKTHTDLLEKCIELIKNLRYFLPTQILDLSREILWKFKHPKLKKEVLEVIKALAKFDYSFIKRHRNYAPQRIVLDFIKEIPLPEQITDIDYIEAALAEILNTSISGATSNANTFTWHFGAVTPSGGLQKLRKEAIHHAQALYEATNDVKIQLKLVDILNTSTQEPHNVDYTKIDGFVAMMQQDLQELCAMYSKSIFGKDKTKLAAPLAIVKSIEEHLYWINRGNFKCTQTEALRSEILANPDYQLFKSLVGNPMMSVEDGSLDAAKSKMDEKVNEIFNSITKKTASHWRIKLNEIASQLGLIQEWEFSPLKELIYKIASEKPSIADLLLTDAFKSGAPLKNFVYHGLLGFRKNKNFALCDKMVGLIVAEQSVEHVSDIVYSLDLPAAWDSKDFIRDEDIAILEDIIHKRNQFSFLKEHDRIQCHALVRTLGRLFKHDSKKIEALLVALIEVNKDKSDTLFDDLTFIMFKKLLKVAELQNKTIKLLTELMVQAQELDHNMQETLAEIGNQHGLQIVLDVFSKRMERRENERDDITEYFISRYDAIPHHFNPALREFIADHPEYLGIVSTWVERMTGDWSLYGYHTGEFIRAIGKGFKEIIQNLIRSGKEGNLLKATRLMHSISPTDTDLSLEIVAQTKNKKILGVVEGNLYSMGGVTGEYGVAEAYEKKAGELKHYETSDNENVKSFVNKLIDSFKKSAVSERKRVDDEKNQRASELSSDD